MRHQLSSTEYRARRCGHIVGVEMIQYDGGREVYERGFNMANQFLDDYYFLPYCPLCGRMNPPEKFKHEKIIGD